MGDTIGNAANGQGALGFLPGVIQSVLAGSDYQNTDAQTRLAHMLVTGGLAAAGQPGAAVSARSGFSAENLAAGPGARAVAQEGALKAQAGVEDITAAHQAYTNASAGGNPVLTAVTKARWLRATGHPVPPDLAAMEAQYAAQANEMAGFTTDRTVIGGPGGPISTTKPRPEQFTMPGAPAGTGPTPGAPGARTAPGTPAGPIPASTDGPGNPSELKQHTGGPPDMFMIDRGDGKGLQAFRMDQGADGASVYTVMSDKEAQASRDHWAAQQSKEQVAYNKSIAEQMTAHAAATSVQTSLIPLAKRAFKPEAEIGDNQKGYWASQMYAFHAPWESNTPQQAFSGSARQALAKVAASLKMRPGPRSLDALEASHYRPGDSLETVTGRLSRLSDLPDNELRAMLAENGFTPEAASVTTGTAAAPMAAHASTVAPAAPTPEMNSNIAAIIRNRKRKP